MSKQTKKQKSHALDVLVDDVNAETDRRLKAKRERDARVKREKRAALKEAVALIEAEMAKPPSERVKLDVDEPVPVRLSVVTLAKDFADACAALSEAERAFDQAVAHRGKAKAALDAEIAKLANEVGT